MVEELLPSPRAQAVRLQQPERPRKTFGGLEARAKLMQALKKGVQLLKGLLGRGGAVPLLLKYIQKA